ncbi:MAG: transcriptional repressor [Bacteroidales bacterium]|nr:transcriptional repressor [Bacteroidales bacterium]
MMDAIDILHCHKVKKSSPRVAIIQALQSSLNPLSQVDVKEKMGALYDRITFYRSAQTLLDAGIIHRIVAENTVVKYALNHCDHGHRHVTDHVHFFCTKCCLLLCLNEVKVKSYQLPEGFAIFQSNVVIHGLCNQCSS